MTHNVKLWNGKNGKMCHSNAVVDASIVILYLHVLFLYDCIPRMLWRVTKYICR